MTAAAARLAASEGDPVDWSQPTVLSWRELAHMAATPQCCLIAEIGAMLRLTSQPGTPPGLTVEADVASYQQAARLRHAIAALTGNRPRIQVLQCGTGRADRHPRYLLTVAPGAEAETLIRRAQLTDPAGRPLAGMPWPVVAGRRCDCAAAWRGAFLAAGSLSSPARSRPALTVACPTLETALALAGAARRIGITARARETRSGYRVTVAGEDDITLLLHKIGSPATAAGWLAVRADCQARETMTALPASGPQTLTGSNYTRSQQAAAAAVRRTHRALEILGDEIPEHVRSVARLRMCLPAAPLYRVGELADPPLSKDTVAGRLRTLYRMADRRAAELGIPNTELLITPSASG
jgi:hypothetical protein